MIQKIREVVIENIKNVEYGVISFTEEDEFLNVTGIYGQNGSGKTTLIDVLELLKELIIGRSMNQKVVGMLDTGRVAKVTVVTEILEERINTIELTLQKQEDLQGDASVTITSEKLYTRQLKKGAHNRNILSFDKTSTEVVTLNTKDTIASQDALGVIKDVITEKKTSYLFSSNFSKLIQNNEKLAEHLLVLEQFRALAKNIRVYTSEYSGLISANIMTPVGIHYKDDSMAINGILPFQMQNNGGFIPQELLGVYQNVIQQMNILLPEIIPGLQLDIVEREVRLGKNGLDEIRLEFIANREGKRFSLAYESDGIKKIIGLLTFLVEAYNDPNIIAAVDEFDSGVFEYLLGELVDVMATGAKGQLIFTSHNLRVLEMLPTNRMVFSTSNPKNRYIRMKGVKRTNNLRDFYLRAIQLGGQEEELYDGQPSHKIRMALIKAGAKLG